MPKVQTSRNGQIIPQQRTKQAGVQVAGEGQLVQLLGTMGPQLARALPRHVTPDRMSRVVLTALRTTPKLHLCTAPSFLGAVMSCAQLGLEPNTPLGHAWLIPRKNAKLSARAGHDVYLCTLIIGYQGQIELSYRSGLVRGVNAVVVREGDAFDYEFGLEPKLRHKPSSEPDREKRAITHVYAVSRMKDGEPLFGVLTRPQIEVRRARSGSPNEGPWVTDYEAMCAKTAVRALWRWMPKSAEMARAQALEDAPEAGKPQSEAWDPDVQNALLEAGLSPDPEPIESESAPGDLYPLPDLEEVQDPDAKT